VGAATTVATWTAEPLDPPNDDTTAVRGPRLGDGPENVTVRDVDVAAVTVTAPLLKTTVLADGVDASNPVPAIVNVAAFAARLAVLDVTVGADGGGGDGPGGGGPGGDCGDGAAAAVNGPTCANLAVGTATLACVLSAV
jgi:hypothetical protein